MTAFAEFNLEALRVRSTDQDHPIVQRVIKEVVQPDWENGPWLAGGSLRRYITGDKRLSDFDVFFKTEEQRDEFVARIKAAFAVKSVRQNPQNATMRIVLPADPFSEDTSDDTEIEIQAIHINFYESAQDVIDSFDYTICQLITDGTRLLVGPHTLWDLGRKRLALHRVTYAVATMRRMIKYTNQGFYACPGMMAELFDAVVQEPTLINREFAYID